MKTFSRINSILTVLLSFVLISCEQQKAAEHCKYLLETSNNQELMQSLDSWVVENIEKRPIDKEDLVLGGLKAPGIFYLKSSFRWSELKFNPEISQIRLIGPTAKSFTNDEALDIKSVFFTELSGYGFLVDVNEAGLGLKNDENKFVHFVGGRISVLCADYDR